MSNRTERLAVEALIIATYKDLLACLRTNNLTPQDDWAWWGEGARLSSASFQSLKNAARALGMGDYDYARCDRVINGLQYAHQKV